MHRLFAIGLFVLAGCSIASAQDAKPLCGFYNSKTVNLVVGGAPGGGFDAYARILAPIFEDLTGGKVVISNVDGGGGRAALRAIAEAKPDGLTMGLVSAGNLVLDDPGTEGPSYGLSDFTMLATAFVDSFVWVGRPGFDIKTGFDRPLVFAVNFIESALVNSGMSAHALGLNYKFVPGYSGSSDFAAATIRGEVDLFAVSSESAQRLTKGGDLQILLSLTDMPLSYDPEVPYLGGSDGLVSQWAPGDADALALAHSIELLGTSLRSLVVSSDAPEAERSCLSALVFQVVSSQRFADDAAATNRSVTPLDGGATTALLESAAAAQESVATLSRDILDKAQ